MLPACLESVRQSARSAHGPVEVVVAINRCTDNTEAIALEWGATIVHDDSRNLARIRNTAASAASGEFLVTIDADSTMSLGLLGAIETRLRSGTHVGGGVTTLPDRWSIGTATMIVSAHAALAAVRLSGGAFWCRRSDFEAIGGFNETYVSVEDIEFARRLRALGKARKQRFTTIRREHIVTSMRKFDRLGDWYFLRHPRESLELVSGKSQAAANRFWYDIDR